jgi:hypothetical protein
VRAVIIYAALNSALRKEGAENITRACSRRSRLSRRLLAQAPRQPSSLLKLVLGGLSRFESQRVAQGWISLATFRNAIATEWRRIAVIWLSRR